IAKSSARDPSPDDFTPWWKCWPQREPPPETDAWRSQMRRVKTLAFARSSFRHRLPIANHAMRSRRWFPVDLVLGGLLSIASASCTSTRSVLDGTGGATGGATQTGAGGSPGAGGAPGAGGHDAAGGSPGTGGMTHVDAGSSPDVRSAGGAGGSSVITDGGT